jgi:hypothetical protein
VSVRVGVGVRVAVTVVVLVGVRLGAAVAPVGVRLGGGVTVAVRVIVAVFVAVGVRVNVRVMVAVRVTVGVKVMVGVRLMVGVKDGVGLGPSVLVTVAVGVTEGVSVIVEVGDCVGVWGAVDVSVAEAVACVLGVAVGVSVGDGGVTDAAIVAVVEGVGAGAVSSCKTRDKSPADTRPSTLASEPGHEFWPKMAATSAAGSADSMIPLQFASPASTSATAGVGCMEAPARATTNRQAARRDAAFLVGLLLVRICSPVALFRIAQ